MTAALAISLIIVGPLGTLPHIAKMWRSGSAAGQSAVGWLLGVYANTAAAYVSVARYDAALLAVGNALGCGLCLAAAALILTLNRRGATARRRAGSTDGHEQRQRTGAFAALVHEDGRARTRRSGEQHPDAHVRELACCASGRAVPVGA